MAYRETTTEIRYRAGKRYYVGKLEEARALSNIHRDPPRFRSADNNVPR